MQKHLTDGVAAPVRGEPRFQVGLAEDAVACAQAGLGPRRGGEWGQRVAVGAAAAALRSLLV